MRKQPYFISCFVATVLCQSYHPRQPVHPQAHQIPDHIKAFSLFIEKPTAEFIGSVSSDEISAVGKAKKEIVGTGFDEQRLSDAIGRYSPSAKVKFDQMITQFKFMLKDIDEATRAALLQMHEMSSNIEDTPTREEVVQWIASAGPILSSLNPTEQATIEKDLPHLGNIMLHTSLLKVRNVLDAQIVINELVEMFNQHLIVPDII